MTARLMVQLMVQTMVLKTARLMVPIEALKTAQRMVQSLVLLLVLVLFPGLAQSQGLVHLLDLAQLLKLVLLKRVRFQFVLQVLHLLLVLAQPIAVKKIQ